MKRFDYLRIFCLIFVLFFVFSFDLFAAPGDIERVSITSNDIQANGFSYAPKISSDGRYVTFSSDASNLVTNDTNNVRDIFVYDNETGVIERVSVSSSGVEGNKTSYSSVISSNGRYIAFTSDASNLVPNDTGCRDIFLYDRKTKTIEKVSIGIGKAFSNGYSYHPSISSDGRYVAFASDASNLVSNDTNNKTDIFVYDSSVQLIERVSISSMNEESNGNSYQPSISSTGRYVVFVSEASNLVSGDTNDVKDIFVYDRHTHLTERVSVDSSGNEGNGECRLYSSITSDGRYVAFSSEASNLVPGDTNNTSDIFVHDRQTHLTERVSVNSSGKQSNSYSEFPVISPDGKYVVFSSPASNLVLGDTNGGTDIFVYDRQYSFIERINTAQNGKESNNLSISASISANGQYIAFDSMASNLVSNDTNNARDIFIKNKSDGSIKRINVNTTLNQTNGESWEFSISSDGRYLVFSSKASNLVSGDNNGDWDIFIKDQKTGVIERITSTSNDGQINIINRKPKITSDGRFVVFFSNLSNLVSNDNNKKKDVFLYDRKNHIIKRISVNSNGIEGNNDSISPSISDDGRYIVFNSMSSNLVKNDTNWTSDIFLYDAHSNIIKRININSKGVECDFDSSLPVISANGEYIAFESNASNLVPGDTNNKRDVFVYNIQSGVITRVSINAQGIQGDGDCSSPSISYSGRYVAFVSKSSNLVPNDNNNNSDIFVFDMKTQYVERISVDRNGNESNDDSYSPFISSDGRYVAFVSDASNLVPNDTNDNKDIFVYDRIKKSIEMVNLPLNNEQANNYSAFPYIFLHGKYIAFTSEATNLIKNDTNHESDIFIKERKVSANFNIFTSILNIPYFLFKGNNYWLDLELIQSNPIKLKLKIFGENSYINNCSYCSVFNLNSKILHIPEFDFGGKSYWLDLKLDSTNPIIFTLKNYGKN
jgi:Tol biopolymer transport system component